MNEERNVLQSITPSRYPLSGIAGSTKYSGLTPLPGHKWSGPVYLGSRPGWEPFRCDCCGSPMGYGDLGYEVMSLVCLTCADACYAEYTESRTPGFLEAEMARRPKWAPLELFGTVRAGRGAGSFTHEGTGAGLHRAIKPGNLPS